MICMGEEAELYVSVEHHRYVYSMKTQSDTYEENHREEKTCSHKHCKEEKPSYLEGSMGERVSSDMCEPGIE